MQERPFTSTLDSGVLTVSGSIDEYAVMTLRNQIAAHSADYTGRVVIELSDVDYLPSVAIGVLAKAMSQARRAGGSVELVARRDTLAQRMLTVVALPYRESPDDEEPDPSGAPGAVA
ncbi:MULTISPECIES: STAS domain-containing protein [Nocardioides]|uniref:STAS domain-containing protein n=1 Tax=Nocardioides kribbensis TaxID=305517 RepID=A0ABV1P1V2_9ACTN|nr:MULTISPECIES: STAS domain-containing protein [Nocardioides]KQP64564.1 hypothetical protein ASF47_11485 [Nocardioides sp. Leaf285]KQQ43573.1 hypothetical protein ASF50_06510 [Nocardioides sp. Leaf307]MBJ7529723.1 STAS domain-containing protein [Nocardioides sp.]MCM3515684.1 STAS domain-containing protein [Nocardioides sp. P86]